MDSGEMRAFGQLGGKAIAAPAVAVRDVHQAVAGRVFGTLGAVAAPVRIAHDAVTRVAYGAVDRGLRAPMIAAGAAVARGAIPGGRSMAESPVGSFALGALNGMWGDSFAADHPELALPMSLRRDDDATPRIAVFVHGLCETDDAWGDGYGRRLRDEHGFTPVYVRYNSGLHVSDNGKTLSAALDRLVADWPVEVDEVALIGHSMGGLVSRSACHYGDRDGHSWTRKVRHVVCLGSPHLGAPLERLANRAGRALSRLPETRPLAAFLDVRSAGVKDMRFGSCVEEDWCDCDPHHLSDECTDVPFLTGATYYYVGATLTRDPDTRTARLVGDLLVQYASASGSGPARRIPFDPDHGAHVGGVNHLQLLNHPAVYEQISRWLARRALPAAA
jgi:pimeloyl-ACP methyl ester carboxylesterase